MTGPAVRSALERLRPDSTTAVRQMRTAALRTRVGGYVLAALAVAVTTAAVDVSGQTTAVGGLAVGAVVLIALSDTVELLARAAE